MDEHEIDKESAVEVVQDSLSLLRQRLNLMEAATASLKKKARRSDEPVFEENVNQED